MKPVMFVSLLSITIGSVQAAPILGSLWEVSNAVASNAVLANVPITPPDVTFEVNAPLQFNNGTTVNAFLNSGGAFNVTGLASALSRAISPSLIQFTGQVSVTNGQQFTVAHDDGLTLIVGGTPVINVPGPTAPTQTVRTYSGPSGTLPFTLVYGECCQGSAVLQINLPLEPSPPSSGVPEPATFSLTAAGLGWAVGWFRRNRLSNLTR